MTHRGGVQRFATRRGERPNRFALTVAVAILLLTLSGTAQSGDGGTGHANPADVYCVQLGYELRSVEREYGGQHTLCVFSDGDTCDAWAFFQGRCGAEYSFCARNGYNQIIKTDGHDPFSPTYAVCVLGRDEVGSVTRLMDLAKRYDRKDWPVSRGPSPTPSGRHSSPSHPLAPAPPSFDWRTHNGQDWTTPAKNQSACGSCWAFAAAGATEAAYNIYTNHADLDLDLSEEYLNSDCSSAGSCCGGSHGNALNHIKTVGIPDEECMPYDVAYYGGNVDGDDRANCDCFPSPPCEDTCSGLPGSCSHLNCSDVCGASASGYVTIADYHAVPNDPVQIKQRLVDEGPLSVSLAMSGVWDPQNVYRCSISTCWDRNNNGSCETVGVCTGGTCSSGLVGDDCSSDAHCDEDKNDDGVCDQDDCGSNHCILLVGYDDAGGFWITKNSWGDTWGQNGNGFFEVGYGECHIENDVLYVEPADINLPPMARAGGPYTGECAGATTDIPLDGGATQDPNPGDSLTYAWTTDCVGGSIDDPTSPTPVLTVDTSSCSASCNVTLTVTDDAGLNATNSSTVTVTDTLDPAVACPADVIVECDQSTDPAETGIATSSDQCDPDPVESSVDDVTTGPCPEEYTITRTWTATDCVGRTDSCPQVITVGDTTAPTIQCPDDVWVLISAAGGTPKTDPQLDDFFAAVSATDICDPIPAISDDAPGLFPLGETLVTFTAEDCAGNPASCAATVTVLDHELPLKRAEKAAWCGLETALAAVADIVEHQGCDATKGKYDVGMDIFFDGSGTGYVDNVDLEIILLSATTKGEKWEVTGNGDLDNVILDTDELLGKCQNNFSGEVIIGNGKIKTGGVKYDWVFIKDIYEKILTWGAPEPTVTFIDRGLESITKLGYPRAKYRQNSKYQRPNGGDGKLWAKKTRIAPNGAPSCTIFLKNLRVDSAGEGLQVWGKLQVK